MLYESPREGAMRHRDYTLTPAAVRAHAEMLCQKHLRLQGHGPKCTVGRLWAVLFYAACRISSIAAACKALVRAPSDTAVHDALLATLPDSAELQRRVNRALQGDLPKALRRRRQPLAIDLHLVPYHGLPLRGRKVDHPDGPSGSRVFATWKRSGWSRYTLTDAKKRTATVAVCVKCRNRRGERGQCGRQALVYAYGGGLRPGSYQWVKET